MIITTTTTTLTTTTTTTTAAVTTTTAVGSQIVEIGISAILLLIALLVLRDIYKVELDNGKINNNKQRHFLLSFVNSSAVFIIPLCYAFFSIIFYKLIIII